MTQVLIDSLLRTAQISLLSVGLTLVYSLLRFPNFAHVEFAVVGAYIALVMNVAVGLPIVPAAAVGLLVTGALGATITPIQIWILIIAAFSMLVFYLLLKFTRLGIAMRATADNAGLSAASGF